MAESLQGVDEKSKQAGTDICDSNRDEESINGKQCTSPESTSQDEEEIIIDDASDNLENSQV